MAGGSVWESNLLFTDTSSTYEEAGGQNRKELASCGTPIAALLPPRFLIPLFSSATPFQRPCCSPPALHPEWLACKCSWLSECPNAAEALAGLSNPLATTEARLNTSAENCASRSDQGRHVFRQEAGGRAESSTATAVLPLRKGSGTASHWHLLLERSRPCTRTEVPPNAGALAGFCSNLSS